MLEQGDLVLDSAAVADKRTVRANDSVAGNDYANRIPSHRFYENSCQGPIAPAITAAHAEAVMSCFYPCSGAGPAHSTIRTRVCNLRRALQVPTVARTLPGRDIVRFRQERSSPRGCAL